MDALPDQVAEIDTSLAGSRFCTLKYGDCFLVADRCGDIGGTPHVPGGLFYRDTRYLSGFEFLIEGKKPFLLNSVIHDDNRSLSVDLTNAGLRQANGLSIPRDVIAIQRTKFLWKAACYERIGFHNYDSVKHEFRLSLRFEADFHDIFEVRGASRSTRGRSSARIIDPAQLELRYDGLDHITRLTTLSFSPAPGQLQTSQAIFDLSLGPGDKGALTIIITCDAADQPEKAASFVKAYQNTRRELRRTVRAIATVQSSNAVFDEIVQRSVADVYMLATRTEQGCLYPYAGIPWFSTFFGRDGIITAMMLLWSDPSLARGVLLYLAKTQATNTDPLAEAEPGKILHERRQGEMANLREVPFGLYYGTVDATPLYVMLAGLYLKRTGDMETIAEIWPHVLAALNWCDVFGDRDRDGFVEYYRETEMGLVNQGWKDSQDSIFHADGTIATGPIALCEVQGYVYSAKRLAAEMAEALGIPELGQRLATESEHLRERFHMAFWCDDISTYALALDGEKRPCKVRSSNAGHALFCGIAEPRIAHRLADQLLRPVNFSGWGIRTIGKSEIHYNPMSYHNGSVWPHDNAMIAMGFARYGLKDHAVRVFSGMFDASAYQDMRRLPELFCGFTRHPRRGPTAYPVACSPQAWAAASPLALVAACLGLTFDHEGDEIRLSQPRLPDFLDDLTLGGLRLGSSQFDVRVQRHGEDVTVTPISCSGSAKLVLKK